MRSIDAPRLQPTAPWGRCSLHQSLAHHIAKDQVDGVLGNRSVHSIPNLLAGAAVLGSLEKSLLDEADVFGPEDRHGSGRGLLEQHFRQVPSLFHSLSGQRAFQARAQREPAVVTLGTNWTIRPVGVCGTGRELILDPFRAAQYAGARAFGPS